MERMTIKKKVMAFVMSVLMLVVGMVPGGMQLVDVKAADGAVLCPDNDTYSATSIASAGDWLDLGNGFELKGKSGAFIKDATVLEFEGTTYTKYIDFQGKAVFYSSSGDTKQFAYIKFHAAEGAKVKIYWTISTAGKSLGIYDYNACIGNNSNAALATYPVDAANAPMITEYEFTADGDYAIGGYDNKAFIYRIEIIPPATPTTSYNVTVKDEKAAATEVTNAYEDGTNITLTAGDEENFLYWVNEIGRVISRNYEVSFPVYYSDTYTAVYKSTAATVNYMTYFGQQYVSYSVSELSEEPEGPTRYGYEFDKWSMTIDEIKAAAEAGGNDVEVIPLYKEVTETISITVDGTTSSYKKNEVVKADASEISNFSYWKDESDNVLSYNPVYYFFASKAMTINAVKDEIVTPEGVVQYLDYITSGTNKSFVFMFTVPEGCHIEFAGIAASNTVTDPTLISADTLVRGRASDSTTVRYTWTKTNAASETWYVKPILKYKDADGNLKTVEGSVVSQ